MLTKPSYHQMMLLRCSDRDPSTLTWSILKPIISAAYTCAASLHLPPLLWVLMLLQYWSRHGNCSIDSSTNMATGKCQHGLWDMNGENMPIFISHSSWVQKMWYSGELSGGSGMLNYQLHSINAVGALSIQLSFDLEYGIIHRIDWIFSKSG